MKVKISKRNFIGIAVLAAIFAAMFGEGWYLTCEYESSFSVFALPKLSNNIFYVLFGIVSFFLFAGLIYCFKSIIDKNGIKIDINNSKKVNLLRFLLIFGLFEIVYLVVLFCCYPGFFNYDGMFQTVQVLYDEVPYNAHHPLLHTLIEGGIIKLGYKLHNEDLTLGVFLYNAFQMTMCAVTFSYVVEYIKIRFKSKFLHIFSIIYFAIHPTVIMFAMSTTKDIFCYLALLIAIIKIYDLYAKFSVDKDGRIIDYISISICLFLSAMIRKNIVYALVVFTVFAVILAKKHRVKILIALVAAIMLSQVFNTGLTRIFHAKEASFNEALSVPYQQLNRVYIVKGPEAFTEEELALLFTYADESNLHTYDPVMADYSKATFGFYYDDVISKDKGTFVRLWFKKGIENPGTYIESFLYNTYQAWYPLTRTKEYKKNRYYDVTVWNEEYSKPLVSKVYDTVIDYAYCGFDKFPVYRLIFLTGLYMWITLYVAWDSIMRQKKGTLITVALIGFVTLTNFIGPVSDIRYYLILFYALPVLIGMCRGNR